jgi:hypothetical protein
MSRRIRIKNAPATTAPSSKRQASRSSSLSDPSDEDDGYSGVEDISDSEDEEAVHVAEEDHMIHRAWKRKGVNGSPRPQSDESSDYDDSDSDEDEEEDEKGAFEEDDEEDGDAEDDEEGGGSWNGIASEAEDTAASRPQSSGFLGDETPVIKRHVRFAGVSDSDSDSTTTDLSDDHNDFFPDIFVDKDSLDPRFRREIEYDPEELDNVQGTFFDFEGLYMAHHRGLGDAEDSDSQDTTPTATPGPSQPVSGLSTPVPSSPVEELDGYESESV